jgi:hypothetical protein
MCDRFHGAARGRCERISRRRTTGRQKNPDETAIIKIPKPTRAAQNRMQKFVCHNFRAFSASCVSSSAVVPFLFRLNAKTDKPELTKTAPAAISQCEFHRCEHPVPLCYQLKICTLERLFRNPIDYGLDETPGRGPAQSPEVRRADRYLAFVSGFWRDTGDNAERNAEPTFSLSQCEAPLFCPRELDCR